MEILRDKWAPLPAVAPRRLVEYLEELRQTLEVEAATATQNIERAQEQQQQAYDRGTQPQPFQVGDQVLV